MQRARGTRALPWSIASAIGLALLCLVAFPGAASAADVASVLVVTCAEDDAAGVLPPEPICEVLTVEDDEGFFAAAPICDPSGASAVAPPPVFPIGDDRMEETPGCHDIAGGLQLGPRPSGDDSPHHQLTFTVDPGLIPEPIMAPAWSGHVSQVSVGALLGPSDGIRRAVEHPPHAA